MQLKITFADFANVNDTLELTWDVLDIPPARTWFGNLANALTSGWSIEPRFCGFPEGEDYYQYLRHEINRCISVINNDGRHHIAEWMPDKFDRDIANKVHHHFEILRGPVWQHSEYELQSPAHVKRAVSGLNDLIHRLESYDRQLNDPNKDNFKAAVTVMFYRNTMMYPPKRIRERDYKYFNLRQPFGTLVLHYAQIGKTWFEVFLDQDEEIFPNAIQKLRYIRADFDIRFENTLRMHDNVITAFHEFLRQHGQNPEDPRLGLGFCDIARLRDNGMTEQEIVHGVRDRQYIKDMVVGSHFQGRFRPRSIKRLPPHRAEYHFGQYSPQVAPHGGTTAQP